MLDGVPTHLSSPWQWGPLHYAESTSYSLDQVLIAPLCLSVSHRRLRFLEAALAGSSLGGGEQDTIRAHFDDLFCRLRHPSAGIGALSILPKEKAFSACCLL